LRGAKRISLAASNWIVNLQIIVVVFDCNLIVVTDIVILLIGMQAPLLYGTTQSTKKIISINNKIKTSTESTLEIPVANHFSMYTNGRPATMMKAQLWLLIMW